MSKNRAFTIVELLVVIVVIGVLAAITVVSYTGLTDKAVATSLKTDLTNASRKLQLYYVDNGDVYPQTMINDGSGNYCPTPEDTKYCIKLSGNNSIGTYQRNDRLGKSFFISVNNGSTCYSTIDTSLPINDCTVPVVTIAIGSQTWAQYSANTGTKVNAIEDTPQAVGQKWCYDDNSSNCDVYGGLYQRNVAMNGSNLEGAQGICPEGFHIPSASEWSTMYSYLSTDLVNKLKLNGSSGFDMLYSGYRSVSTEFSDFYYMKDSQGFYWTSTSSGASYTYAHIWNGAAQLLVDSENYAMSVRCIKN